MRFILVDRILDLVPGRSIRTVKNVTASEDVFADHFPGVPIMPGALILESFVQSAMLMLAAADDFRSRPAVTRVRRAAFRHFVRPGDRLTVTCEADADWVVQARGTVEDRTVATAVVEFEREAAPTGDSPLRQLYAELTTDPGALAAQVART